MPGLSDGTIKEGLVALGGRFQRASEDRPRFDLETAETTENANERGSFWKSLYSKPLLHIRGRAVLVQVIRPTATI